MAQLGLGDSISRWAAFSGQLITSWLGVRGPNARPILLGCANDQSMSRREKKRENRRDRVSLSVVLRCGDGKRTEPSLPNPNVVHIGILDIFLYIVPIPRRPSILEAGREPIPCRPREE